MTPAFAVPRVIVWHNAVARIPFLTNLFRGPYDTHFGIVRVEDGEVEQDVTYEGSDIPNRLRLSNPVRRMRRGNQNGSLVGLEH